MQNNWEKELGRALKESVGEPDAERMAMTAEALHKAYRGKHRERIGFTGFLLRQIRFNAGCASWPAALSTDLYLWQPEGGESGKNPAASLLYIRSYRDDGGTVFMAFPALSDV